MPELKLGIPRYQHGTVYIPLRKDWYRYYDPAFATAHEIGHSIANIKGKSYYQNELYATLWAMKHTKLIGDEREFFMDEARDNIRMIFEESGVTKKEFMKMLKRAEKSV